MLPIYDIQNQLLVAFEGDSSRVVIEAPTGSGKSTQVPQMLLDAGLAGEGQIVVLQPRRLAARVLANRVAEEREERTGQTVGYEVRFERCVSKSTRIRYITEGVLLRAMLEDPRLSNISVILFDEFHERHLYGDLSLAMVKQLQQESRPDLKIGVMSATLQSDLLNDYLAPCVEVNSEGRMFPVEVEYLSKAPRGDVWDEAAAAWKKCAQQGLEGDVLIFMPGSYEIDRTLRAIENWQESRNWEQHALHAELPPERQDAALKSYDRQKVIVSTNVAETSLTINGIRTVIDSGLVRQARFDPNRGFDALTIDKISHASAEQRQGRAGRTAPGRCIRLWTEADHRSHPAATAPEIKRVDLAEVLLTLHGLGVEDPRAFDWVEAPLEKSLARAEQLLSDLGAITEVSSGQRVVSRLTETGKRMLRFPVHPRFSRMLIEAGERKCVQPVAIIAALCQGKPLMIRKVDKRVVERRDDVLGEETLSDFSRELRAFEYVRNKKFHAPTCRELGIHIATARQTERLAVRLIRQAESAGLSLEDTSVSEADIRKCMLVGFADQVARRKDGGTLRCELVHRRRGEIERGSLVRDATFVVAAEITEVEKTKGNLDVLLRRLTAVDPAWLTELFPGECVSQDQMFFDASTRRVLATRGTVFRELVVESSGAADPDPSEAARLLAEQVLAGKLVLKQWTDAVDQWIVRLNCLAEWYPEAELTAIDTDAKQSLVEQICFGAFSYKEIKDRQVMPVVKSWLSEPQQILLEQMVPERYRTPDGKHLKLRYQEGKPPVLAAKIQNLYDMQAHPVLVNGNISVVLEILAPNFRPIQVTQDLPGFWQDTYHKIKPELARRYPKHEWR
ncbi:MAG: ATP-dependent helicase HrpB [Verrucomicrobiota bacterium]